MATATKKPRVRVLSDGKYYLVLGTRPFMSPFGIGIGPVTTWLVGPCDSVAEALS